MHILTLDHATINTADLDASLAFYKYFFGLTPGKRPPFDVDGAWLYPEGGCYPIIHLVLTDEQIPKGGMFNHVAFHCVGVMDYLEKVKAWGGGYAALPVPETELVQIQHYDPNNVFIEATFHGESIPESEIRN